LVFNKEEKQWKKPPGWRGKGRKGLLSTKTGAKNGLEKGKKKERIAKKKNQTNHQQKGPESKWLSKQGSGKVGKNDERQNRLQSW